MAPTTVHLAQDVDAALDAWVRGEHDPAAVAHPVHGTGSPWHATYVYLRRAQSAPQVVDPFAIPLL